LTTDDLFLGGYWNASADGGAGGNGWWSGNGGGWCEDLKISWRWTATGVGSGLYPVNGVIEAVLGLGDVAGGQDLVVFESVYSEFNTVAWLRNAGVVINVAATASVSATGAAAAVGVSATPAL
jgi:hypothetical protein